MIFASYEALQAVLPCQLEQFQLLFVPTLATTRYESSSWFRLDPRADSGLGYVSGLVSDHP
jgi:hypothetical protein